MNRSFRLNKKDNVAVVLFDAVPGDVLDFGDVSVTVTEPVPYGHKVALTDIRKDELIYKYGFAIGRCTRDAAKGSWMHIHNIASCRGEQV